MKLVAGRVENHEPSIRETPLQFLTGRQRDGLVLPAVQDERRFVHGAKPITDLVTRARLVLPHDGVQRHLAEMPGILRHPLRVLEDELRIVEGRVALQWMSRGYRRLRSLLTLSLAATARGAEDQAPDGIRLLERHLLNDHAAQG